MRIVYPPFLFAPLTEVSPKDDRRDRPLQQRVRQRSADKLDEIARTQTRKVADFRQAKTKQIPPLLPVGAQRTWRVDPALDQAAAKGSARTNIKRRLWVEQPGDDIPAAAHFEGALQLESNSCHSFRLPNIEFTGPPPLRK